MGIVIIGGLLFSLALTLYVIPAMYTFLSREKHFDRMKRIEEIASKDHEVAFEGRLSIAEYLNVIGKRSEALQRLETLPPEATKYGLNFISLESRLALTKLQIGYRSPAETRRELAAIKREANRFGFKLISQRADRIRP